MIKLIEKKIPKTTYVMELDTEEMKEIWSIVGTAKFECQEGVDGKYKCNTENMKKRVEFLRYIEKSFYDAVFETEKDYVKYIMTDNFYCTLCGMPLRSR